MAAGEAKKAVGEATEQVDDDASADIDNDQLDKKEEEVEEEKDCEVALSPEVVLSPEE